VRGRARPVCVIEDCDAPHMGLGWCQKHYRRFKRTGDPLKVRPPVPGQKKTHCIRGHELSGDNVYIHKTKGRRCRACGREWLRDKRAREKGATS